MLRSFGLALSVLGLVFLNGCDDSYKPVHVTEYKNVLRVFMHEPNNYTLLVRSSSDVSSNCANLKAETPTTKKIDQITFYHTDVNFFDDVKPGEEMWARFESPCDLREICVKAKKSLDIHVHSMNDINGAGWNRGKGGHGQTIAIE